MRVDQITAANAGKRLGFAGKSRVGLRPRFGVAEFLSRHRIRHVLNMCIASTLLAVGCTAPSRTDFSPYYPATAALRQDAVAHSVPTNAPFGSLYEVGIYIVQPADTLDRVLERFHLTVQELASRNGYDPDSPHLRRLLVGQRLVIYEHISH